MASRQGVPPCTCRVPWGAPGSSPMQVRTLLIRWGGKNPRFKPQLFRCSLPCPTPPCAPTPLGPCRNILLVSLLCRHISGGFCESHSSMGCHDLHQISSDAQKGSKQVELALRCCALYSFSIWCRENSKEPSCVLFNCAAFVVTNCEHSA